MRIAIVLLLAVVIGAAPLAGCAGKRTVTTTETHHCPDGDGYDGYEGECHHHETTVVEEEHDSHCHGAVSCSLSMVGHIIALPFRILGEVLGAVF